VPQAQLEHEPAPRPQVDEQAEAASHGDDVESADQGALDADVQPTEPTHIAAPPASHPPWADLSGDALTTSEAMARHRKGECAWAQCSLAAARNLLRDTALDATLLAERQTGMAGQRDTAVQGLRGDIRFPDWPLILRPPLREGEVIVRLNPRRMGSSELLHDMRLVAMVFLANTHVIAIHRDDQSARGRITFRKYDNDSDARRRGTFECVSARHLWVGSCEMIAIVLRSCALHQATGDVRPAGSLREQRHLEMRTVLGSLSLSSLLPTLNAANIRTLATLHSHSISRLESVLRRTFRGAFAFSASQRRQLVVLGLSDASVEPQRMER
jgi:hypothetical protein